MVPTDKDCMVVYRLLGKKEVQPMVPTHKDCMVVSKPGKGYLRLIKDFELSLQQQQTTDDNK